MIEQVRLEGFTLYRTDTRCGLAVEDRDLVGEANNIEGQEEALVGIALALYPMNDAGQRSLTN